MKNCWVYLIDGILWVGIEVMLVSVIELEDDVFIFIYGCFGYLLIEIVEWYGVNVYMFECEWGMVFDLDDIIWEMKKVKLKIVVMVYGEILIGWIYLLKVIGEVC